jgi:8-oxo-dGTP diphosphatase
MTQVVAAIIKKEDKYLLARRAGHKIHGGQWEFPGGKIDLYETPEEAVVRELYEEFKVKTETIKHLVTITHDYIDFKIELMAYESVVIAGDFELNDHDQISWLSLEEISGYNLAEADRKLVEKLQTLL